MTVVRTCAGCAFEGEHCRERERLRAALRGLGVTSVKHRCHWRRDRFRFGQAVWAETVPCPAEVTDEGYDYLDREAFPATFIQYSGSKCVCYIAPDTPVVQDEMTFRTMGGENGGYVKVPRNRVSRRDSMGVPTCRTCHSAIPERCHDYRCPRSPSPAARTDPVNQPENMR